MQPIRLGPFLGANLALQPKLLPDGVGVNSINHKPHRGDLRPWKEPLTTAIIGAGKKTIHMLARDATSDSIIWFEWTTLVHAVRGFNADDSTARTYYTGSGAPKVTDNLIGLAGAPYPTSYRDLGIPKPTTAPVVTQTTAGTGDDEERIYAYAFLSDWDEIGMPQISAVVTCKPGAILSISNLDTPPSGAGENRGINRIRIWRTVNGERGAEFFFLRDIMLATSSEDDARQPGQDTMPSQTWAMPPSNLKHLTGLWNGMMAGISGNAVRYCEVFKPHAWPAAYETLCTETPIALGAYQKTLVVLTTGRPRAVYGDSPEAMTDSPIEFIAACVSPASVASMGHGVCWATSDGLAYVGTAGAPRLLTDGVMLVEDWKALNPDTIVGCQFAGLYFGFYDSGAGALKGFWIDPLNPAAGIQFLSTGYQAAFFDPLEEQMYVLDGTSIRRWDAGASSMTVSYTSKVFRLPRAENPGCAEVISDGYPVTFKLYAGTHGKTGWPAGSLRLTRGVANREPFMLPGGYLADDVQMEVSGTESITGVAVAGSVQDLAQL